MIEPPPRAQQAEREAGQTTFSRGVAGLLVTFFAAVVAGVPVADLLRAPSTAAGVSHLLPPPTEVRNVLEREGLVPGVAALNQRTRENLEQWETDLEQASWLRPALVPPLNRFLSGALGAGNARVWQGRDGWMFYAPAIGHLTGPGFLDAHAPGRDPVTVLADFGAALAERGIQLVAVPIPVKASIYPERLSSRYTGATPVHNPDRAPALAALRDRGVLVCEVTGALMDAKAGGSAYLASDSHWTPRGQAAAVSSLADFLRAHIAGLPPGNAGYTLDPPQSVENAGDLAALLAPEGAPWIGRETVLARPVRQPDGTPWAPDTAGPVLLLGDSFANIYGMEAMGWGTRAGMAARLAHALQVPVDAITQNGEGAYATRLALNQELRRGRDRLAAKRVVVFAFSARELSMGDWKPDLTLADAVADSGTEPRP